MNKIVDLVNAFAAYEQAHPGAEIADFCKYYLQEQPLRVDLSEHQHIPLEGQLGRNLGRLFKFTSFYSRKTMQELSINNLEDFIYLAGVMELQHPRKSDLIHHCLSEFTSGIGVISRLINMGLLMEQADLEDARSKRLSITELGKKELYHSFDKMSKVGKMVFSALSIDEQHVLLSLLKRLDQLHTTIYADAKNKSLEEIEQMLNHK